MIDFASSVILKPWGHEYVVFQNKDFAIWKLFVKKGEQTSYHCHLHKKSAIIVLSGRVLFRNETTERLLLPSDMVSIEKGEYHSTKALIDASLLELNIPPLLTDLVRKEDKYNRQGQPYENNTRPKTKEEIEEWR